MSRALRRYGLRGTARLAIAKSFGYGAARRRLRDGRHFDAVYGTRTAEIRRVEDLTVDSPRRDLAVRYEPSPPETVIRILRALPIDYERYVFVDVGAGMGRVVLLASTFPFKAIVGVEFAPELVGIARDNIRVFPDTEVSADRVEVVCVDAVDFALPDDDLVLYLFNPFAVSVLDRFLENVTAELGDHRDVVVALLGTPEAEATIARYGFVQIAPHIHRRTGRTAAA